MIGKSLQKLFEKELFVNPFNREILYEKIYDISKDVDTIYNVFFSEILEEYTQFNTINPAKYETPSQRKHSYYDNEYLIKGDFVFGIIDSKNLRSVDCKKANQKLPLQIIGGVFENHSFHKFSTIDGAPCFISISLNKSLVSFLKENRIEDLPKNQQRNARNELSETRVKGAIAHELSHWIDNANYDIFRKIIGNASTPKERSIALLLNKKDVNATYFEIQAQVHSIAIYKKSLTIKQWNALSMVDIFRSSPALFIIAKGLYKKNGIKILKEWFRLLFLRLNREGLLGDNMKKDFNIKTLLTLLDENTYISGDIVH